MTRAGVMPAAGSDGPRTCQLLRRSSFPKEVQKAPEDWRLIGAEVSEQLDYEPGRFLRRRLVRRKYVRRGDLEAVPVIAALPPSLQERCIAAPGLGPRCASYPLARSLPKREPHHRTFPARDTHSKQGHAFANRLSRDRRLLKEKCLCRRPGYKQKAASRLQPT